MDHQLSELFRKMVLKDESPTDVMPRSRTNSVGGQSSHSGRSSGRSRMRMDEEEETGLLEMKRHETEKHCQVATFQKSSCSVLTYAKVIGMISMMTNTRIVRDDDPSQSGLMIFKIYGNEVDCKKAVDCMVDRLVTTQDDSQNDNYERNSHRNNRHKKVRTGDFANYHCKREKRDERYQERRGSPERFLAEDKFQRYRELSPSFTTDSDSLASSRTVSVCDDLDKPSLKITFRTKDDIRQWDIPQLARSRLVSGSSTDTDSTDELNFKVKSKVVKMYRHHSVEESKVNSRGCNSSDATESSSNVLPRRRRRCTIGRSLSEPMDNHLLVSDANNNGPVKPTSPGVYNPVKATSPEVKSPPPVDLKKPEYNPPHTPSPVSPDVPLVRTTFGTLRTRVCTMKNRRQRSLPQEESTLEGKQELLSDVTLQHASVLTLKQEDIKSPVDHLPGRPSGPTAAPDFHLSSTRGALSSEGLESEFAVDTQPDGDAVLHSSLPRPSPKAAHPPVKREPLFRSAAPIHKCPALAKRRQLLRVHTHPSSSKPEPAIPKLTIKIPEVLKVMMRNDSTLKDLPQISEVEDTADCDALIPPPEGMRFSTFRTDEQRVTNQSVIFASPILSCSSATPSDPELTRLSSLDSVSAGSTPGVSSSMRFSDGHSPCSPCSVFGEEDINEFPGVFGAGKRLRYERCDLIHLLASPHSRRVPSVWPLLQEDFADILLSGCHGIDPPLATFTRRWRGRHHSEGQLDTPFGMPPSNITWKTWTPSSA